VPLVGLIIERARLTVSSALGEDIQQTIAMILQLSAEQTAVNVQQTRLPKNIS